MFFDNTPESRTVRIGWHTFKHQGYRAIGQWPIDDIAMPRHPANIGSTPIDITIMVIKNILMRHRGVNHIAARGVENPFWFAG